MKITYEKIRAIANRYPWLKKPKHLKERVIKDYGLQLSKKEDKILGKNCWEILNRTPHLLGNTDVKVLVFDIETAPLQAFVWKVWKENISPDQLISEWFCISWSAKWLFETETLHDCLTPEEILDQNDSRIVTTLWHLLERADIVIAHNGKRFDIRKINSRFLIHKMTPPMPYEVIDTLIHMRKRFALTSNRLDYVGQILGLGGKKETGGFELWKRCMSGDAKALNKMVEYCDRDVKLLEDVYLTLRPWIQPHPNIGLHFGDDIETCPTCGSVDLIWHGSYATYTNLYDAFRCNSCGSRGRSRKNGNKRKRKNLTTSLPT